MLTRSRTAIFLLKICILFSLISFSSAQAQNGANVTVRLTATAQLGPDQIVLHWPADATATIYTVSRGIQGVAGSTLLTVINVNADTSTGYTDTTAVAGQVYEYTVVRTDSGPQATGYITSGITVPLAGGNTGQRGTVILVVANDAFADIRIAAGIQRLTNDLNGDGWKVISHNVPRDLGINAAGIDIDHGAAIRSLKATIRADYNADPTNVKAVFLFGHVPVPYSGNIAPDSTGTTVGDPHFGAWPADVYYGDMGLETYWTDTTVNNTGADDPRNWNVPGDGKFDQGVASGLVQLQVGRVDLANMPAFAPKTEFDLLSQYLDKDHSYRQGYITALPVGRIAPFGFGNPQDAWRSFSALLGQRVTTSLQNEIFTDLGSGSFLWTGAYSGGGAVFYNLVPEIGSTANFAATDTDTHSMFYMLAGVYLGDWDHSDDFLRAPLATPTYGLTAVWDQNVPNWFFQDMGMGSEIGYSTILTQNIYNTPPTPVYAALMGDPTLREHVITPASQLQAVAVSGDVQLSWVAPLLGQNDPNTITGYAIYRQDSPTADFLPLATVTGAATTTYTDTGAAAQNATYQVRAVSLYTSKTGTYYNQSQGIFAAFDSAHVAPIVTLVSPVKDTITETGAVQEAPGASYFASDAGPVEVTLAAQVPTANEKDPGLSVAFYQNGTFLTSDATLPFQTTVSLKPGNYTYSAVITDATGATSTSNILPINVYDIGADRSIFNGTLSTGWSDTSVKTQGQTTLMSDSFGVADPNPANSPITGTTISVDLTVAGSSFILKHKPIDTSKFPGATLGFYINGGTIGGQTLTITTPLQDSVTPNTIVVPFANGWQFVAIPISGITAGGDIVRNFDGLKITSAANGVTPKFYLANLNLFTTPIRSNRAPGVAIHLNQNLTRFTVQTGVPKGQPIAGTGDAGTSDGAIAEVDLSLNGAYYGRGVSAGPANQPYSPFTTQLPTLTPGSYTLTAAAVTTYGATSISPDYNFVVVDLPTVSITAPTDGAGFVTSTPISVTANATAATNGIMDRVQFFQTFNGVTTQISGDVVSSTGPYGVTFTPNVVGSYVLTAVATDDLGGVTTSAPITINVGAAPTVVIDSPTNGASFATPATVPIAATATQGSNPIARVDFYSDGVQVGTDSTSPYTFSYANVPVGTHTLTAITTDTIGLTGTSPGVVINVGNPPTVVITAPADGAPFAAGTTVPIAATATAGSNPIVKVDFYANGQLIGTDTSSPYTFNYANVPVGTITLTAIATDSINLPGTSAPITIHVGIPPTVRITSPNQGSTFVSPATIPIYVTALPGTNPVIRVDFYSDGALIGSDTTAPYTLSYATTVVGPHVLTAKATDSIGLTTFSTSVTVNVNSKPTIVITAPANGATFVAPVTVTVTATTTPGNHPIAKVQLFADGTLIGTDTASPYTFAYANVPAGTHLLAAKAIDTVGLTALSSPVSINVNSKPTIQITSPTAGQAFVTPVTIPVTASATAGNHPITKVEFFVDGALIGTDTSSPYTVNYLNGSVGTHSVAAKATDSIGLTTLSAPVSFNINSKPTIVITAPSDGATYVSPITLPITANAAPGNHPISKVEFFSDGLLIGTDTSSPYTFSYANIPAGKHILTAIATDSIYLAGTSNQVTITVNSKPTITITAPTDGQTVVLPTTVSITARVVAGNNPITQVEFFVDGASVGTDTTSPYTFDYANPATGQHTVVAKVTDSIGLTAVSPLVTFNVNSKPTITITAPTNGQTFVLPVTVPLTATVVPGNHAVAKVQFFVDGAVLGTLTSSPYTFNYVNPSTGSHTVVAKVIDTAGLTATSSTVTFNVDSKPTITITSPSNGTKFVAPATITIAATAKAGNHPITKVDFFADGILIGTDTTSPYTINYTNVPAATHVLLAKATDTAGLTALSTVVNINVVTHQTVYGLVTRNFDGQIVKGITLTFKRQADNSVTTAVTTATAGSVSDGKTANYAMGGLEPGPYTVTLTYLNTVVAGPQTVTVSATQPTRADFNLVALHTFPSGQQMFSVPFDYSGSGMSLAEILATNDAKVSVSDSLTTYQTVSTLKLGQGYWGTFPTGAHIWLPGSLAPTTRPFTIPLKQGWNMIGDPFLSSVAVGNLSVIVSGGATISISSAANQGIIAPNLSTFFAGDTAYRNVPVNGGGSLAPYAGYWIHALQDCTLSIPPPAGS